MLGFADTYTTQGGFLHGETFVQALMNVTLGVVRLLGLYVPNPPLRSMPEITGQAILQSDQTHVVAGLNSELFINFGYAGIFVGMLLLGLFAGWVDRRFAKAENLIAQLGWAYLGSLVIFRTLAADANALASFLIYSGAPVLVMGVLAYLLRDRCTLASEICETQGMRAVRAPAFPSRLAHLPRTYEDHGVHGDDQRR